MSAIDFNSGSRIPGNLPAENEVLGLNPAQRARYAGMARALGRYHGFFALWHVIV